MEFKGTKGNIWDISTLRMNTSDNIISHFYMINDGVHSTDEEIKANEQLISCAPEMLEMLIKCYKQLLLSAEKGQYPEIFLAENGGKGLSEITDLIKKATTI